MGEITIALTPDQVADAEALARDTHSRWAGVRGYYRNTYSSHRLGKLGEVAVEAWATGLGSVVEGWFRDPSREKDADLLIDELRVAVKTWAARTWEAWGRCVRPKQVGALQAHADRIVWCYVSEENDEVQVTLTGWSTPDEIAAKPITLTGPTGRQLENHQVSIAEMHDIDGWSDQ